MATYQYCDHSDHDNDDGQFTPATTTFSVVKRDAKQANTINTVSSKDACDDHIGEIAEALLVVNRKDPLFDHIRMFVIGGKRL